MGQSYTFQQHSNIESTTSTTMNCIGKYSYMLESIYLSLDEDDRAQSNIAPLENSAKKKTSEEKREKKKRAVTIHYFQHPNSS